MNDGPDTCTAGELSDQSNSACVWHGYRGSIPSRLSGRGMGYLQDSRLLRAVSGSGLQEHDPRQWEVACETGADIFINSEDLAKTLVTFNSLFEMRVEDSIHPRRIWRLIPMLLPWVVPRRCQGRHREDVRFGGSCGSKQSIFANLSNVYSFSFDTESRDERLVMRKACSAGFSCSPQRMPASTRAQIRLRCVSIIRFLMVSLVRRAML